MKDVFYKVIEVDFVVLNGKRDFGRRAADEGRDFDGRRSIEQRVKGAGDLVQMLMTEKIVGYDDRPEEEDKNE